MLSRTDRPSLEKKNYQQVIPGFLKSCLEEESQIFFKELENGEDIHALLDTLSTQATQQK